MGEAVTSATSYTRLIGKVVVLDVTDGGKRTMTGGVLKLVRDEFDHDSLTRSTFLINETSVELDWDRDAVEVLIWAEESSN